MAKKDDLLVAGPGSPISFKKIVESGEINPSKEFTVFIDNSHSGFAHDDPETTYITAANRREQALYYVNNIFNGKQVSAYLYRYLHYMFINDKHEPKYKTDQDIADAFKSGKLTEEDEEWGIIMNKIKYAEHNTETIQIIGLVQLVGGALNQSRKNNTSIRLFIEHPEDGLHPGRERMLVSLLHMLKDDYGAK